MLFFFRHRISFGQKKKTHTKGSFSSYPSIGIYRLSCKEIKVFAHEIAVFLVDAFKGNVLAR